MLPFLGNSTMYYNYAHIHSFIYCFADCFFREGSIQFAMADYYQALELDSNDQAIQSRIAVIHNEYGVEEYLAKNYKVCKAHSFYLCFRSAYYIKPAHYQKNMFFSAQHMHSLFHGICELCQFPKKNVLFNKFVLFSLHLKNITYFQSLIISFSKNYIHSFYFHYPLSLRMFFLLPSLPFPEIGPKF